MNFGALKKVLLFLILAEAVFIGTGGCAAVDGQGLDFNPYYFTYKNRKVVNHPGSFQFDSQPIPSNLQTIDFFALGCAGTGQKGQKLVADVMNGIASQHEIDYVVYLGDNFYSKGVRSVSDKLALATYVEWQEVEGQTNSRLSTALFRGKVGTPNNVEWLHVHETWLAL